MPFSYKLVVNLTQEDDSALGIVDELQEELA